MLYLPSNIVGMTNSLNNINLDVPNNSFLLLSSYAPKKRRTHL